MSAVNKAIANLSITILVDNLREALQGLGQLESGLRKLTNQMEGINKVSATAVQGYNYLGQSMTLTEKDSNRVRSALENLSKTTRFYTNEQRQLAQIAIQQGVSWKTLTSILGELNQRRKAGIGTILETNKQYDALWRQSDSYGQTLLQLGVRTDLVSYANRRQGKSLSDMEVVLRRAGVSMHDISQNMSSVISGQTIMGDKTIQTARKFIELNLQSQMLQDRFESLANSQSRVSFSMYAAAQSSDYTGVAIAGLSREYGYNEEEASKVINSYKQMTIAQQQLGMMSRALAARTNVVGQANRALQTSFFWAGLGSMFMVMSIGRAFRATENIRMATRSLEKSKEDETRAWDEARESVMWYGQGTKEAENAMRRAEDATEAVTEAERRLQATQEQSFFNWLQLGLTILPTVSQTYFNLQTAIRSYAIAQVLTRTQTNAMTKAEMELATAQLSRLGVLEGLRIFLNKKTASEFLNMGSTYASKAATDASTASEVINTTVTTGSTTATGINTVAQNVNTASTWAGVGAKLALVGALTLGIGAAVGLASALTANAEAAKMSEESIAKLEDTTYGHSLYDAFVKTSAVARQLALSIDEIRSSANQVDIDIQSTNISLERPPIPITVEYTPDIEQLESPEIDYTPIIRDTPQIDVPITYTPNIEEFRRPIVYEPIIEDSDRIEVPIDYVPDLRGIKDLDAIEAPVKYVPQVEDITERLDVSPVINNVIQEEITTTHILREEVNKPIEHIVNIQEQIDDRTVTAVLDRETIRLEGAENITVPQINGPPLAPISNINNHITVSMINYVRSEQDIMSIRRELEHLFQVQFRHMGEL